MRYMELELNGFMQHYPSKNHVVAVPSSCYFKTEKVPTRNAVLGMIGAALGVARKDKETLSKLDDSLDIRYKLQKKGVVEADLQTARPLHDGDRFLSVQGKLKQEKENIVLKRVEYLYDYKFSVYVGGEEDILNEIRAAFECPVYPPVMGKRSCIAPKMEFNEGFVEIGDIADVYDCP